MDVSSTIRKTLTAMLMLAIVLWAEAGLALVAGNQVMQCSVTMHHGLAMSMPCCPDEELQVPAATHPECCSNGDAPERPLGFVVSSKLAKPHLMDMAADVPASLSPLMVQYFGVSRSGDAPRFVKPVLELKTDLRI